MESRCAFHGAESGLVAKTPPKMGLASMPSAAPPVPLIDILLRLGAHLRAYDMRMDL